MPRANDFKKSSIPDGYVEDDVPKVPTTVSRNVSTTYTPVAATLVVTTNLMLNHEQGYDIKFSAGMMEGCGLVVSDDGSHVTVTRAGSYRCEVCGSAVSFSDVGARLLFFSDTMSEEMQVFAETAITGIEGTYGLRGISTILSFEADQVLRVRLLPDQPETIMVHSGFRWMIHRVA
jgi:hypothetical protein